MPTTEPRTMARPRTYGTTTHTASGLSDSLLFRAHSILTGDQFCLCHSFSGNLCDNGPIIFLHKFFCVVRPLFSFLLARFTSPERLVADHQMGISKNVGRLG